MASTGARAAGATTTGRGSAHDHDHDHDHDHGRTPAQYYCLIAGLALLLAGIAGFFVDATFDTAKTVDTAGGNANGMLQGDSLLGFEVNGWHNVVHLLSGLVLLAAASKWRTAKTVAIAFGVVYGIVTIIGLIDGNDVLGLIPINAADNVLHAALSLLGIISGLISRPKKDADGTRA